MYGKMIDGCPFTAGELEAVRARAKGSLSSSSARSALASARERVGASSPTELLIVCFNAGWLDPVPLDGDPVRFADRRVTWAQRLYLEAFDQHLRAWAAGDEVGERRTRRLMAAALDGVVEEAGATPVPRRVVRDPLDGMAAALTRRWPDDL